MHFSQVTFPEKVAGKDTLFVQVSGYPDEAIRKAHEIAHLVLGGNGSWHFTSLELISPMARGLGDRMDSEWLLQARAQHK